MYRAGRSVFAWTAALLKLGTLLPNSLHQTQNTHSQQHTQSQGGEVQGWSLCICLDNLGTLLPT
jgi:hypothetical protein